VQRLQGQFRIIGGGMAAPRVIGIDMNAAFAMGAGMGIHPWLIAEFLPDIEAAAVGAINKKNEG
jgi:hypothetical protein